MFHQVPSPTFLSIEVWSSNRVEGKSYHTEDGNHTKMKAKLKMIT
jgi:hypothetical protein